MSHVLPCLTGSVIISRVIMAAAGGATGLLRFTGASEWAMVGILSLGFGRVDRGPARQGRTR